MFIEAALARRELARNLENLNYSIDRRAWRKLCMAIKRDLQAQRLRPNVSVPPRRNVLSFLSFMTRETGSLSRAIAALMHDGAWTSSGGSFRLAEAVGLDFRLEAQRSLERNKSFRFLEVGAGWAGYRSCPTDSAARDIASLGDAFDEQLGQTVSLHFTNLTPWHGALPEGVYEHPYVSAAGLGLLERQGIGPGTVDILYSQAAAYFETDHRAFMNGACRLVAHGGILIFNHRSELSDELDQLAAMEGLELRERAHLGGMNGDISRYDRMRAAVFRLPPRAARPASRMVEVSV